MQVTIQGYIDENARPSRIVVGALNMTEAKAIARAAYSDKRPIEIWWERSDAGVLPLAKWNLNTQQWLDFARNISIALQESSDADR